MIKLIQKLSRRIESLLDGARNFFVCMEPQAFYYNLRDNILRNMLHIV